MQNKFVFFFSSLQLCYDFNVVFLSISSSSSSSSSKYFISFPFLQNEPFYARRRCIISGGCFAWVGAVATLPKFFDYFLVPYNSYCTLPSTPPPLSLGLPLNVLCCWFFYSRRATLWSNGFKGLDITETEFSRKHNK